MKEKMKENKEFIVITGAALLMCFVSFMMGYGFGAGETVELGNGCVVYENEMYCQMYDNLEIVFEKR